MLLIMQLVLQLIPQSKRLFLSIENGKLVRNNLSDQAWRFFGELLNIPDAEHAAVK